MKFDVNAPDNAWLNLVEQDVQSIENPLLNLTEEQKINIHLYIISVFRNPKYFAWTCKVLFNIELHPQQVVILQELWNRNFPIYIASRGYGKSFLLAIYCTLKCLLVPDSKIVICGAAFRQSKIIFDYMDTIWKNAPLYRSVCSDSSGPSRDVDRCTMRINTSWTTAIPIGTGDKIRGLRAHTVIADEFNSIPVEIFETVIQGFASVSKDPIKNVKLKAKRARLKESGDWKDQDEHIYNKRTSNQIILAGTAGYDFEPFAQYWKRQRQMITGRGEEGLEISDDLKSLPKKALSIVRIPYDLVPLGFMDEDIMARAKATTHSGTFAMEYGASFAKDSQGFFKKTLIESCVASDNNVMSANWPAWCSMPFSPITSGNQSLKYVYGIDPASEVDNFAITVLEVHENHSRVVYCWTTNRKDWQNRKRIGITDTDDYYSFCVRKIRDLMLVFPCARLGIDSQGGGIQIAEGLRDKDKMKKNEVAVLPFIDKDRPQDTDSLPGLHIIEFINFASAEWTSNANHGLRKDMEDKFLLFPRFDPISLGLVTEQDKVNFERLKNQIGESEALKLYDTLEDCTIEIEELKAELVTIQVTRTPNGREKFDTPEFKMATGKKGRIRKDRYSALLIANAISRNIIREVPRPIYTTAGMAANYSKESKNREDQPLYMGRDALSKYKNSSIKVIKKQ